MNINSLQKILKRRWVLTTLLVAVAVLPAALPLAHAQGQYDQDQYDPPGRVARLGYMQGSISFQPAGESEWVEAVANRPMTTGDRLWADRDGRAEVELGSASIHLAPNTGFSLLNLDDRTVQIELSSGTLDLRIRRLDRDSVFEVDTPNQALTALQPGRYRIEASEDGNYTVVTIREGEGESTGNGQAYTIHAGQRITLSGNDSLNAELQQISAPDEFDNWSNSRDRRYDNSRSSQYCSQDLVGMEDLDDNGDWRSDSNYGNVWYPRVSAGWAPYHDGHWAWIDPWGWTWVDDSSWGYAPFHYGRWASVGGRWGWIPGPRQERSVYAPALVAFVGGGSFAAGSVAWFPLGPREVYVPSYRVSQGYVNRVNVTNTTVNTTTVTNVYNTTIVNKSTTITNVNYVNRNVQGAVTAVPQRAFASAQPVARNAVRVNARDVASGPVNVRAAVPPAREAILGAHANTANRVAAPPKAVAARTVIAKATPPPTPASFAAKQQALQAHPGQSVDRTEMRKLRPASADTRQVKQAPPAKPATPTQAKTNPPANGAPAANARPGANASQPARPQPNNEAPNNRPEPNRPEANRPDANRPPQPPARNDRPANAEPNNRPNQPAPNNRPDANRPDANRPEANRPSQPPDRNDRPANAEPNNRPNQPAPNNRPEANRPEPNRPEVNRPPQPPDKNDRPAKAEPNDRPNQPAPNNRPEANRPEPNRPEANRPPQPPDKNDRPAKAEPNDRPNQPAPNNRPEANRPEPNRPEANRPPQPPARNDRPANAQPNDRPNQPAPNNRPDANRPEPNRPEASRPEPNRPDANRPPQPPARNDRPANAEPSNRPNQRPADNRPDANRPESNRPQDRPEAKPAGTPDRQQPKPLTPEEKKRQEEQRKEESQPPQ